MPMMDQWPEQQLAYARDLRRIYNQERARQRELEATNRALAAANAELAASNAALAHANRELDRRICDLIAVQDWVLAVNSSRDLPALMDLMAQPLVLLLRACTTVVYPWEPAANALGRALGYGILVETPALAALRTSALSAAVLAAARRWEVADLAASDESGGGPSYAPARALGWRAFVALPLVARDERQRHERAPAEGAGRGVARPTPALVTGGEIRHFPAAGGGQNRGREGAGAQRGERRRLHQDAVAQRPAEGVGRRLPGIDD